MIIRIRTWLFRYSYVCRYTCGVEGEVSVLLVLVYLVVRTLTYL